jgi:hypothetical protein
MLRAGEKEGKVVAETMIDEGYSKEPPQLDPAPAVQA